mmetsp:Transcript_11402/g.24885  ORF Transcript_11402/g.24885 Transcript_11402/m.24885 type:complete len:223 (-) Transcript_11402:579-1247(-)
MPEEKHEQSSPPSALHDTSNVSPLPCSSLTASPCCSDQMDTFPPSDPVATYSPLGLGARLYTGCVCLHRSNIISPDAPDHTFTVPSNEAVQSWLGRRGFLEPGPVGVQRRVNISFRCPRRSNLRPSSAVQIFAVLSSEQLASMCPPGLQQTALTSSSCPVRQRRGTLSPVEEAWQMYMLRSEEQVANESQSRQSTSSTGPVCSRKTFTMPPPAASHTMARRS